MTHSSPALSAGRIAQAQAAADTVIAVKRWRRAIVPGSADADAAIDAGQRMFDAAGRWLEAAQLENHSRARHGIIDMISLALVSGDEVAG